MLIMVRMILAVGVALMLLSSSASAQTRAAVKACAADIQAQCGKLRPGSIAIRDCVKTHLKDFSPKCQAALEQARTVARECAADIKQNCASVKPGGSRIEACLQAHLTGLSNGCKAAISGTHPG